MAEIDKKKVESKVVSAVGTSANAKSGDLAKRMEAAMVAAINKAMEDGITDPDKIRAAQLEARAKFLQDVRNS